MKPFLAFYYLSGFLFFSPFPTRKKILIRCQERDKMSLTFSSSRYRYRVHEPGQVQKSLIRRLRNPEKPKSEEKLKVDVKVDFLWSLIRFGLEDVALKIVCDLLEISDLTNVVLVSKFWKRLVDNEMCWKSRLKRQRRKNVDLFDIVRAEDKSAKEIVRDFHLLDARWRQSKPLAKRRLEFDSFVLSVLQVEAAIVVVGLNNGRVEEWTNFETNSRSMHPHSKGVKTLAKNRSYLLTGSYDATIKVFNVANWTCLRILNLHDVAVWEIRVFGDCFVSCGMDGNVFIVKGEEDFEVLTSLPSRLKGEDRVGVSSVDLNGRFVACGGDDALIAVWERDAIFLRELEGHKQGVISVRFHPLNEAVLASGSYDARVRLWNVLDQTCLAVLKGHRDLVRCIEFLPTRIISADFGGFVKIWQVDDIVQKGDGLETEVVAHASYLPHRGHVTCLNADQRRILSASRDKSVFEATFWSQGSPKAVDVLTRVKQQ